MPLTRAQLVEDLIEVLFVDPAELTEDTDLTDLGLDSLRLNTLLERWRATGARIGFADLAEQPVLGVWFDRLVRDDQGEK
ncbi:phosphopantetheine-binding protein [Nocardia sp. IBHARD005]|uniref:phosphopantetheine-binding protein n=1 Tax=Nocardia sp. IBHARD005 TaxID=3457765 RepID=UPI0040587456